MASNSRPHRMSGFYALFFLGNVLGVPLNLLLGQWAGGRLHVVGSPTLISHAGGRG
ncbi:MAG TPA: hypothetical protein VFB89_15555 [Gemmatimonadales bacterium]|nr:hypothetical protein [Gemmatimonadales bacterium]